ncbi:MAG: hypothetical protein HZB38_04095 [Planctomycetes bacterium]|nr:hypothetical protein [Planctomycetota bacterium]
MDVLKVGDTLNLTGPLGHGFDLPSPNRSAILVGGGVGIPPLLYMSRVLAAEKHRGAHLVLGAMSRDLFPVTCSESPAEDGRPRRCLQLPGGAPYAATVTTDDGTIGLRGRVTDGWQRLADREQLSDPIVYACGPSAMLRGVAVLTRSLGWDCQLCIERNMGCGMGTCLSCVTRVRDESRPAGWRWALACSEGPVFDRDLLVEEWDHAAR